MEEASDPDFDVRQILLDRGEEDKVYYLDHGFMVSCEELEERFPDSPTARDC
jgi:hypothetical protein